jgi:hypothetical protein
MIYSECQFWTELHVLLQLPNKKLSTSNPVLSEFLNVSSPGCEMVGALLYIGRQPNSKLVSQFAVVTSHKTDSFSEDAYSTLVSDFQC